MTDKELLQALRRTAPDNHRCFGCGHEHNCGIHGCAINRKAADTIESLQAELTRVKAERDAMLVDLKKAADDNGRCYGCKYLDEDADRCRNKEYALTCCLENNMWEWRGLEADHG